MTAPSPVVGSEQVIALDDRARWESALEDVPHAFAHTWINWRSYLNEFAQQLFQ